MPEAGGIETGHSSSVALALSAAELAELADAEALVEAVVADAGQMSLFV